MYRSTVSEHSVFLLGNIAAKKKMHVQNAFSEFNSLKDRELELYGMAFQKNYLVREKRKGNRIWLMFTKLSF